MELDSHGSGDIPIWLNGTQRWMTGLTKRTTCDDVIYALLYSEGLHETENTDCYAIFEKWREVERPLSARTKILKIWTFWGQEQPNVQLSMRNLDDYFLPGESSLYMRSKRRHRRNSRSSRNSLVSCNSCQGKRGCNECGRLRTLEQLVKLVVGQERKIQDLSDRIHDTDRLIDKHENRIHHHRVQQNGLDYVQNSYLNSHSSTSSSTSLDSNSFASLSLKDLRAVFPESSNQELEEIAFVCDDISHLERRLAAEKASERELAPEVENLARQLGVRLVPDDVTGELEETRVQMVRAVTSHVTNEYNERELDRKLSMLGDQARVQTEFLEKLQQQMGDSDSDATLNGDSVQDGQSATPSTVSTSSGDLIVSSGQGSRPTEVDGHGQVPRTYHDLRIIQDQQIDQQVDHREVHFQPEEYYQHPNEQQQWNIHQQDHQPQEIQNQSHERWQQQQKQAQRQQEDSLFQQYPHLQQQYQQDIGDAYMLSNHSSIDLPHLPYPDEPQASLTDNRERNAAATNDRTFSSRPLTVNNINFSKVSGVSGLYPVDGNDATSGLYITKPSNRADLSNKAFQSNQQTTNNAFSPSSVSYMPHPVSSTPSATTGNSSTYQLQSRTSNAQPQYNSPQVFSYQINSHQNSSQMADQSLNRNQELLTNFDRRVSSNEQRQTNFDLANTRQGRISQRSRDLGPNAYARSRSADRCLNDRRDHGMGVTVSGDAKTTEVTWKRGMGRFGRGREKKVVSQYGLDIGSVESMSNVNRNAIPGKFVLDRRSQAKDSSTGPRDSVDRNTWRENGENSFRQQQLKDERLGQTTFSGTRESCFSVSNNAAIQRLDTDNTLDVRNNQKFNSAYRSNSPRPTNPAPSSGEFRSGANMDARNAPKFADYGPQPMNALRRQEPDFYTNAMRDSREAPLFGQGIKTMPHDSVYGGGSRPTEGINKQVVELTQSRESSVLAQTNERSVHRYNEDRDAATQHNGRINSDQGKNSQLVSTHLLGQHTSSTSSLSSTTSSNRADNYRPNMSNNSSRGDRYGSNSSLQNRNDTYHLLNVGDGHSNGFSHPDFGDGRKQNQPSQRSNGFLSRENPVYPSSNGDILYRGDDAQLSKPPPLSAHNAQSPSHLQSPRTNRRVDEIKSRSNVPKTSSNIASTPQQIPSKITDISNTSSATDAPSNRGALYHIISSKRKTQGPNTPPSRTAESSQSSGLLNANSKGLTGSKQNLALSQRNVSEGSLGDDSKSSVGGRTFALTTTVEPSRREGSMDESRTLKSNPSTASANRQNSASAPVNGSSNATPEPPRTPGRRRAALNPHFCDAEKESAISKSRSRSKSPGSARNKRDTSPKPPMSNISREVNGYTPVHVKSGKILNGESSARDNVTSTNLNQKNKPSSQKLFSSAKISNGHLKSMNSPGTLGINQVTNQRAPINGYTSINGFSVKIPNSYLPSGTKPGMKTKLEDSNDSDTGLSSMNSDETANMETLV